MSKKTDIWMPIYIGDYLADTAHLDAERSGAYLHLLMYYWVKGPLPASVDDLVFIAKLRGPNAQNVAQMLLAQFFTLGDDGLYHQKRADIEKAKAGDKYQKRALAGARGAAGKWGTSAQDQGKLDRAERLANARRFARHLPEEWQALIQVCECCCVKCKAPQESTSMVRDHILPIYLGGSDGIENIQPMCRKCSAAKGPEAVDYRPSNWRECLAKCLAKLLANACQTPGPLPSQVKDISDASHPHPAEGGERKKSPDEIIYEEYPRKVGKEAALKSIAKAVERVRKGASGAQPVPDKHDAQRWLYRRVQAYARSPAGTRTDRDLIPHPATWFNQGRYLDDDGEWQLTKGEKQDGKSTAQARKEGNRDAAERVIAGLRGMDRAGADENRRPDAGAAR